MSISIPLHGKLGAGLIAVIDDCDAEIVLPYRWSAAIRGRGSLVYAQAYAPPLRLALMHRLIMKPPTGMYVDHIDGNGLNNRRRNLRTCTMRQNLGNSRPIVGTSRYKGVSLFTDPRRPGWGGRWKAQIRSKSGMRHIGYFSTEEEAAVAYNAAAIVEFGEFARLNEIPEGAI